MANEAKISISAAQCTDTIMKLGHFSSEEV